MTRNRKGPLKKKGGKIIKSFNDTILSHREFKSLIDYERTRSDRNGSIFSIIVFKLLNNDTDLVDAFLFDVTHLTRSIDRIGWLDNEKIAVLLPDTCLSGAKVFGQKFEEKIQSNTTHGVSYEIYCYPENWLANENGKIEHKKKENREKDSFKKSIESSFVLKMPLWKRIIDIIGAILLLITLSPIILSVCLYIKIVSPGPILFSQRRIGYKGIPFTFWKFRTMKNNSSTLSHGKHSQSFIRNGDIPMNKLDKKDPRIFIGGRVLRKACLDELPQLWNVLKGEMSLVGPRPCIPYEAQEYLRWHTHRFDTVPGLSGLWQVSGKNKLTFKQMIRLDISYCQNLSLGLDLFIIIKTPYAIIKMVLESVIARLSRKKRTPSIEPDFLQRKKAQ